MEKLTISTGAHAIEIGLIGDAMAITVDRQHDRANRQPIEWSATLLDGEAVNYEKAQKAVAALGHGWRLPTRQELESLLDLGRHDPAIDTDRFPDTQSRFYWTSTPCAWNDAAVWVVFFGSGSVLDFHRGSSGCVRAVRSGQ